MSFLKKEKQGGGPAYVMEKRLACGMLGSRRDAVGSHSSGSGLQPYKLEKVSSLETPNSALNHAQTLLVSTLVLFLPTHASWVTTVLGNVFGDILEPHLW